MSSISSTRSLYFSLFVTLGFLLLSLPVLSLHADEQHVYDPSHEYRYGRGPPVQVMVAQHPTHQDMQFHTTHTNTPSTHTHHTAYHTTAAAAPAVIPPAGDSQLSGAGYALYFDGSRGQYFSYTGGCSVGDASARLDGGLRAQTLAAWIKVENPKTVVSLDMNVFGFPFEQGPQLFLRGYNALAAYSMWTINTGLKGFKCSIETTEENGVPTNDGQWHLIGLSHNETFYERSVDGIITERCSYDPSVDPTESWQTFSSPSNTINFGVYDPAWINEGEPSTNANPFFGWLDEVRWWNRYMSPQDILKVSSKAILSNEDKQGLLLWYSFDEGEGAPQDKSGNNRHGVMGGADGYMVRFPKYVPSEAPLAGASRVVKTTIGLPLTGNSFNVNPAPTSLGSTNLLTSDTRIELPVSASGTHRILLSNVTVAQVKVNGVLKSATDAQAGLLMDANGRFIHNISLPIVLPTPVIYYRPPRPATKTTTTQSFAATGELLVSGLAYTVTLTPTKSALVLPRDAALVSSSDVQSFNWSSVSTSLYVHTSNNRAPLAGSAGLSLWFDGVNDYAFSHSFTWPVANFSTPAGYKFGGYPSTIEWWSFINTKSELDSAVFSIGNSEGSGDWVDDYNPYKKFGRFIARFPFSGGVGDFTAGIPYNVISTNLRPFYSGWTHFAVAHDQANGTRTQIFINGKLVVEGSHPYASMGAPWPTSKFPIDPLVKTLSLGRWGFWSEVYHYGGIDEFRIWTKVRTESEIQRDMYSSLTGREDGLIGYWNFDDIPNIGAPRAGSAAVAADLTGKGNHLYFGGCAPCEDYYKGFMPYSKDHDVLPPANKSANDPGGYLVCLPSAKADVSPYIKSAPVFGAPANCFGGQEQADKNNFPARQISKAPVGGYLFDQVLSADVASTIILNGTDPDGDGVQFYIASLPQRGSFSYTNSNGTLVAITRPVLLPAGVSTVTFQPVKGAGGYPYATFRYIVFDGQLESSPATVQIFVQCPQGQTIYQPAYNATASANNVVPTFTDNPTLACRTCVAGYYSPDASLRVGCLACPTQSFSDRAGATACVSCVAGLTYQPNSGQSRCLNCSDFLASSATDLKESSQGLLTADQNRCAHFLKRPADGGFLIELKNASKTLFTSNSPILASVASLPRFGRLFQQTANAAATSSSSKVATNAAAHGPTLQVHTSSQSNHGHSVQSTTNYATATASSTDIARYSVSVEDVFFTSAQSVTLFASAVGPTTSVSRVGYPATSALGAPDVQKAQSSTNSWSPIIASDGSDTQLDLYFPTPIFIESVHIYQPVSAGALIRIEAFDNTTSSWQLLWAVTDSDRPLLLQAAVAKQRENPSLVQVFQSELSNGCPSLFLSNRVRMIFDLNLAQLGRLEIDAVGIVGKYKITELETAFIVGSNVAFFMPDSILSNQPYTDTFSFVLRDCMSTPTVVRSSIALTFQPEPLPIWKPSSGLQIAVYALAGVVTFIALVVLLIMFVHRNKVVVRSSNVTFCILMLLFCAVMASTSVFYALVPDEHYICQLRIWFTSLTLVGILASLFVKVHQIHTVFNSTKLRVTNLPTSKLLLYLAGMLGIQVILLIAMSAGQLTQSVLVEGTGSARNQNLWACSAVTLHKDASHSTDEAFTIWLAFQFAYVFAFVVWGAYLAVKVKDVPVAFSESAHMLHCIFAMLVFLVLIVPLQFILDDNPNALILLRGIGQVVASLTFVLAVFGPKLYLIFTGQGDNKALQTATSMVSASSTPGSSTIGATKPRSASITQSTVAGGNNSANSKPTGTSTPNGNSAATRPGARAGSMITLPSHGAGKVPPSPLTGGPSGQAPDSANSSRRPSTDRTPAKVAPTSRPVPTLSTPSLSSLAAKNTRNGSVTSLAPPTTSATAPRAATTTPAASATPAPAPAAASAAAVDPVAKADFIDPSKIEPQTPQPNAALAPANVAPTPTGGAIELSSVQLMTPAAATGAGAGGASSSAFTSPASPVSPVPGGVSSAGAADSAKKKRAQIRFHFAHGGTSPTVSTQP